ncbi:MAG: NYN domain-containing protein [Candidatus Rokubacteria bacterium]|nr:NYN domain-containing protein [Candidatus Rokubacteria bacterium]
MRWLIDGYNVIRRDPDLRAREAESLEAGRAALLGTIARGARVSRDTFTVVFDGARRGAGAPPTGRVQVLFSRPPLTADDELARLARVAGAGAVVVSSDRRVQDAARRAGSAVLGAEAFVEALARGGAAVSSAGDDVDRDEDRPRDKRGNPRRLSKRARAAARALRRLRPS